MCSHKFGTKQLQLEWGCLQNLTWQEMCSHKFCTEWASKCVGEKLEYEHSLFPNSKHRDLYPKCNNEVICKVVEPRMRTKFCQTSVK